MSEEKLYAVKNDDGEFLSFSDDGDSVWNKAVGHFETDKQKARSWAYNRGGHVVTFVEEPEKVAVSKEEAKSIDALINAKSYQEVIAFTSFIFNHKNSKFVKRILKAITNGYTITIPAVDTKYLVYENIGCTDGKLVLQARWDHPNVFWDVSNQLVNGEAYRFTQEEIERLELEEYEKEEVTDDEQ